MYQYFNKNSHTFKKDAMYTLMRSPYICWRRFLQQLALAALSFLLSSSAKNQDMVLIADTTILERKKAKKVELCSKVYNYVENKFTKGFRVLFVGFSDGHSFILLYFGLLSSTNTANILQGITKAVSPRSSGGKSRNEAFYTSLELLEKILKALKT